MINGNLWSSHLALKANGNKCQWKTDVGGSYRDCFCFLQKINHMLVQSVVQSEPDRRNRRYQPQQALRGIDSFQQERPDSDKCDFIVGTPKKIVWQIIIDDFYDIIIIIRPTKETLHLQNILL